MTGWRLGRSRKATVGVVAIVLACVVLFIGDTWFGPGGWCSTTGSITDDLEDAADRADPDEVAAAQVEVAEDALPGLRRRADRMIWPSPSEAARIADALEAVAESDQITAGEPGQATQEAVDRFVLTSDEYEETHCSSSDVD
jgi:hypothetical protein